MGGVNELHALCDDHAL